MPGSDGFCEWKAKVAELPSVVYDCKRVKPHKAEQEEERQQQQGSDLSASRAGVVEGHRPAPVRAAAASNAAWNAEAAAAAGAAAGTRQPGPSLLARPVAAAAGMRAAPEGSECYKIKERSECTPAECVWCRNKWSPSESAQGVCVWKEKASELPDWAYSCHHVKPSQAVAAAAAAAVV
jgi:hypothetical protein